MAEMIKIFCTNPRQIRHDWMRDDDSIYNIEAGYYKDGGFYHREMHTIIDYDFFTPKPKSFKEMVELYPKAEWAKEVVTFEEMDKYSVVELDILNKK